MTSLQVLCPNGRRQNVKVSPNTTLLQVLEDVCQKQKFLPAEDYKLVQGRKTIDVTLTVRYTNLPNNAKLELVKGEKSREESSVVIALQLESGERLQHTFHPGTSLWDILLHWETQPDSPHNELTKVDSSTTPSVQPVCIYMREEVIGEAAMRETRLRTLGLTGGKAAIRLTHRTVEDEVLAQILDKIEKEKYKRARLDASSIQKPPQSQTSQQQQQQQSTSSSASIKSELPSTHTVFESSEKNIDLHSSDSIGQTDSSKLVNETSLSQSHGQEKDEPVSKFGRLEKSHDDVEPMEVESTESGQDANMDIDEKANSTATSSDVPTSTEQSRQQAADMLRSLNIPGVQIFTPGDFADLTPEEQQVARRLAQAYLPRLGLQPANQEQQNEGKQKKTSPKKKQSNSSAPFSDFKFPEDSKGKKLYSNELSNVKKEDFMPCDRQPLVFNVEEQISSSIEDTDIPDEFFDLTERDMRIMLADQKKKLNLLDEQPLMTSDMRQSTVEDAYERYDHVVIRVQFPDKLVLQGLFRPRETVFALHQFVKEYMENKNAPFYLYTSPPKLVLKDTSQNLIEAKLVPATVVYFGSEESKDHHLSSALLSEISPKSQADLIVSQCLSPGAGTSADSSDTQNATSGSSKGKRPISSNTDASTSQGKAKPVPKWFKTGKK